MCSLRHLNNIDVKYGNMVIEYTTWTGLYDCRLSLNLDLHTPTSRGIAMEDSEKQQTEYHQFPLLSSTNWILWHLMLPTCTVSQWVFSWSLRYCVFPTRQKVHNVVIHCQVEWSSVVRRLVRFSDMRWACRHRTMLALQCYPRHCGVSEYILYGTSAHYRLFNAIIVVKQNQIYMWYRWK